MSYAYDDWAMYSRPAPSSLRFYNRGRGNFKSYQQNGGYGMGYGGGMGQRRGGGMGGGGSGPKPGMRRTGAGGGGGGGYRGGRNVRIGGAGGGGYRQGNRGQFRPKKDKNDNKSKDKPASKDDKAQKLDKETEDYFSKVYTRFKTEFEDEEDKAIFLANVGEQTCNKELELSRNRSASYCIQMLLSQTTNPNVLTRFMTVFSDDLRMVCTHFAMSHVVQTLLQAGLKYLQNPTAYTVVKEEPMEIEIKVEEPPKKDDEEETKTEAKEETMEDDDEGKEGKASMEKIQDPQQKVIFWVLRIGKFCLSNLKEFMFDTLASHVTRTVLQVLGGCNVEDEVSRSKRSKKPQEDESSANQDGKNTVPVPQEFTDLLKEFVSTFKEETDLSNIIKSNLASPLLQTLMAVLHAKDPESLSPLIEHIGNLIFKPPEGEGEFSPVLSDTSASFIVEKVLKYSKGEYFTKLWKGYLAGHLMKMSLHPVANFCVQRLLECVTVAEEFHEMYEELAPGFDNLLMSGHTTVLVCIAEACKRLQTYQAKFLTKLQETLNCATPEERKNLLVPLTLHMMTYGNYQQMKPDFRVIHQGGMIIQHLLHFNKPQKVVSSLLSMSAGDLKKLACCPRGSHVIESFIQSPYIGEKSRDELIEKLKGNFYDISTDKYGSRLMDNIWGTATMKQKNVIAEELGQKEHLLTASVYGSFVAKKCGIYHYKHRRDEWTQIQASKANTVNLFQDVTDDDN